MKVKYKYALGGGFGGCQSKDWEVDSFISEKEALDYAYQMACEEYDDTAGMYGLMTVQEIMEGEEVPEEEAKEAYHEEREGWLEYEVEVV